MEPGITRESTREPGGLLVTLGIILGLRAPSPVYPARAPLSTLSSPWVPGLGPPGGGPWVAVRSGCTARTPPRCITSEPRLSSLHHKHRGRIQGKTIFSPIFPDFLGSNTTSQSLPLPGRLEASGVESVWGRSLPRKSEKSARIGLGKGLVRAQSPPA